MRTPIILALAILSLSTLSLRSFGQATTFPGNVGIGTSSPATPLDVLKSSGDAIQIKTADSNPTRLDFGNTGAIWYFTATRTGSGSFLPMTFWTGDAERMRISTSGNVGIGTANPVQRFQIHSDFNNSSTGLMIEASDTTDPERYNLRLYPYVVGGGKVGYVFQTKSLYGGTNIPLTFDNAGNVGVHTSAPSTPLSVRVVDNDDLAVFGPANNCVALQTLLDGQPISTYGTYGGDENRLILQPLAGNVGIGTTSPVARLHVVKDAAISLDYAQSQLLLGGTDGLKRLALGFDTTNNIGVIQAYIHGATTQNLVLQSAGGNVGIGTTNPTQKLSVNGTVRAKEVIVDTGWSDYVFDESYKLTALSETEAFVRAEKHLPGIPSAKEVAENGISVGDMQAKLLAKIEELTLHQIEQEKRQHEQATEIDRLHVENGTLRGKLATLEAKFQR